MRAEWFRFQRLQVYDWPPFFNKKYMTDPIFLYLYVKGHFSDKPVYTKNQRAVYEKVNILDDQVYKWVRFFEGQVYEWGRFWNTGSHTRTKITP